MCLLNCHVPICMSIAFDELIYLFDFYSCLMQCSRLFHIYLYSYDYPVCFLLLLECILLSSHIPSLHDLTGRGKVGKQPTISREFLADSVWSTPSIMFVAAVYGSLVSQPISLTDYKKAFSLARLDSTQWVIVM